MTSDLQFRTQSMPSSQKLSQEEERRGAYFEEKAKWKREPNNHFVSGEATPMDGFELVTKPRGDLLLDWA